MICHHKGFRVLVIGIFLLSGSLSALPAHAWGGMTHMALALTPSGDAPLPVDESLLGAFLAGATEPDISASQGGVDQGVSADYHVYHDPAFADAMDRVAARLGSPEKEKLQARALGFRVHLAGDKVAHGVTGYPNVNQLYPRVTREDSAKANHIGTELAVDLLSWHEQKARLQAHPPEVIGAGTLAAVRAEYASARGITLENDPGALKKALLQHEAMLSAERVAAERLEKTKPWVFAEMDGQMAGRREPLAASRDGIAELYRSMDHVPAAGGSSGTWWRKLRRGFTGLVDRLFGTALRGVEKGVLVLAGVDPVNDRLKQAGSGRIQDNTTRLTATMLLTLTGDSRAGFQEALLTADRSVLGDSRNSGESRALLEWDASVAQQRAVQARREYQNRPWWKFWLHFTDSDKDRAGAAEAAADTARRKLESADEVRATPALVAPGTEPTSGTDGAAYRRYLEAVESGDEAAIRAAREALN